MSSDTHPLLTPQQEAHAFWRLRGRLLANLARQALRHSRLRITLVVLLSAAFWWAIYELFSGSLGFLAMTIRHAETLDQVVAKVFEVFFFSLLVMLVFSTGIILYGSLYRSRETRFLLTTPARAERIFVHKFQEAMLFSSWGSVLIGSPLLVAYGVEKGAPWHYYVLLLPALAAFVCIPGALGGAFCMLIVRRLPRRRLGGLLALALVPLSAWLLWSMLRGPQGDLLTPAWFRDMLGRLEFSDQRLLPSWWLSTGLREAAAGEWSDPVLFLALLFSNALLGHQVAAWTAARVYRAGYSRLSDRAAPRASLGLAGLDRAVMKFGLLSRTMRILLVKDLRLFRRDPVQWSQFLVFFGLLALYFSNIRRLSYDASSMAWVNAISFLNLAVVGLILSTFTTRFIFPMISLEGRRFWILGLLPLRRDTILWGKFAFATAGSLLTCLVLISLSDLMLRVPPLVLAMHSLICCLLCLGLSGIAVGLGARWPNLREESPSRIAAGFGGTLCLVLSTLYILAIVVLTAVPCHLYVAEPNFAAGLPAFEDDVMLALLVAGTGASIVLGGLATWLPLRMGFRAFREAEF